jgi:GNAT superfamily N-acetyltransferase
MPPLIRRVVAADLPALAALAGRLFPLACPPHTTEAAKADFIARHLSVTSFEGYLADAGRMLFVADLDGELVGYTMLITGEPSDPDVAAAITVRPTVELSKCYVDPGHHGAGVAAALIGASVEAARATGAAAMWLGVNEENERANRFYGKHGFAPVGRKRFLVGDRWEDDYVRERVLEEDTA